MKETNSYSLFFLAIDLKEKYEKLKSLLNNFGFELEQYERNYNAIKDLIPDKDFEHRENILKMLENHNPANISNIQIEDQELIDQISELIKSQYELGKFEGREAKSLFRSLLIKGKFPPNYLAEFDKRF